MHDFLASFRRTAAIALVADAMLSVVSVVLQPTLPSSEAARLATIGDGPGPAISAAAFVVSQLPFLIGVLGVAWLAGERTPRLARTGAALAVVGGFGHTVFGGVMLSEVVLAHDSSHRSALAAAFTELQGTPVMIFALLGLLGTVVGLLLLSIALFRSRTLPVWVPSLIWAFLVLEFVGSGVSRYASYLAVVLLIAAFGALARALWPASEVYDAVPAGVGQLTRER